jgi:hypothetical protein
MGIEIGEPGFALAGGVSMGERKPAHPPGYKMSAVVCQSSGNFGNAAASSAVMARLPRMVKWIQPPHFGQRPANPTSAHQARTNGS